MMEAARTSETLVNFYQTTRCYNPEDSNLYMDEVLLHYRPVLKKFALLRSLIASVLTLKTSKSLYELKDRESISY
jgi:hypothetical protein